MIKCPTCDAELTIFISSTKKKDIVVVNSIDSKVNMVLDAILHYWRWCAEGYPKYKDEQYWYDNYHNEIEYLGDSKYKYRIQTFDSPEGDTWEKGTFNIGPSSAIEFTKDK